MARQYPQVEVRWDGTWHTVTEDVYSTEELTTSFGRRDWASLADPSEMVVPFIQFESKYVTATGGGPMVGRYAPRNPLSDLFGKIGRTTPVRLRLGAARRRLLIPGTQLAAASTPDVSALRLTGDQRIELKYKPRSWRPVGGAGLGRRYTINTPQRAWAWWLNSDGTFSYRLSTDGSTSITRVSTAAVPDDGAERWIAAWIDVNNGAGGHTVGFETAPDVGGVPGTWTALGSTVVTAGVFSVFAAQAPFELGRTHAVSPNAGVNVPATDGEIGAMRYRSGIAFNSALVSSIDFTSTDTDARTIVDVQGRTWTLTDAAYMTDTSIRFAGEASAWPQDFDDSVKVRTSPATISGVLRRAQKNEVPLQSSLRRDLSTRANVAAYYSLEERKGAPRFASGLAGDTTFLRAGDPTEIKLAANAEAFIASDPLPTISDTTVYGTLPTYTANVDQRALFLYCAPDAGMSSDRLLARFITTGTLARWDIVYGGPGGSLRMRVYDSENVNVADLGPSVANLDGDPVMIALLLQQVGANVTYQLSRWQVGATGTVVHFSGTLNTQTYGRFTTAFLGSTDDVEDSVYGHLAILNGDVHNIWDLAGNALVAWAGDTGTERLLRLARDEGYQVRLTGAGDTPAMGPQRSLSFVELMREVPATDLGLFGDGGDDASAITSRPARSMMGRPVLTLAYELLTPPPRPVDDDQGTVNRVTVKSVNGIEFTAEDTTSPMSTQPPPAGVGLYDQSVNVNANTTAVAEANAWWRLAQGTVDASRWPQITLELARPELAAMFDAVIAVRLGDIIRITDFPPGFPPGPVDLIVDAIGDSITRALHTVTFTCGPANVWGATNAWAASTGAPAGVARWDTANTYRGGASAINATQTSITMTIGDGRFWTTTAGDFPFDIAGGGERMTVTAIAAPSGSTQVFTVVRGAGETTAKIHPVGTAFRLAEPFVWAL